MSSQGAVVEEVAPKETPHPEESEPPLLSFAARIGTFMVDCTGVVNSWKDAPDFYRKVLKALDADPRVSTLVGAKEPLPEGINSWPMYHLHEHGPDSDSESPVFWCLRMRATYMEIEVPKKNQRQVDGHEPPTDKYVAVWDGMTLLVAWLTPAGKHIRNRSGGHVVGEILQVAVEACGGKVVVQSCTPLCEYDLNHTTLLVEVKPKVDGGVKFGSLCANRNLHVVARSFGEDDTLRRHARALFGTLQNPCKHFALMKNHGNQATALASAASEVAVSLLEILRARSLSWSGSRRQRLVRRWKDRHWRRQARGAIASLWLLISSIEARRRDWRVARAQFEAEADEVQARKLFDADYRIEASDLERLNLASLEAQARQAAAQLDHQNLVAATAFGALGGGLAGALITLIVSL